jgi:heavy metal translocating P-type ATPase
VSRASIALLAIACIAAHLLLRFAWPISGSIQGFSYDELPLLACLVLGGVPLVYNLALKLWHAELSSDILAGISIVSALLLGEYLAGALVVLMLSGGEALEAIAVRRASSVLEALAKRMPSLAHRKIEGMARDVALSEVGVGDILLVFPHETCPVDGVVVEGHGSMDESYLTGEPYVISKAPGSGVLSGAINGAAALTIRAERLAADSRYARIMRVMRDSEQRRPRIRRLGDQLGTYYTPLAVAIALAAWAWSGDVLRFLSVLVVATPCPLLIAIPVAIIGSISLAARRGIIVKDPSVLESISQCRTAIFDKTGTLTYGKPALTEIRLAEGWQEDDVLRLAASIESYSKHPLASAILEKACARGLDLLPVAQVSEEPGQGLAGTVAGKTLTVSSRKNLVSLGLDLDRQFPPATGGMESIVLIDGRCAAAFHFHDEPRMEGALFVDHLRPKHHFDRVMLVSGDRESEVRYLADRVGIAEVHAGQSPEEKVAIVRRETARAPTVFLGDGINDAPAIASATVGIAFGQASDIISEAAGAVVLEPSLQKVDELLHIGNRMRRIALESALGGMALSAVAMLFAAAGFLTPVFGAILQELIDVLAVVNALRVATPLRRLSDY